MKKVKTPKAPKVRKQRKVRTPKVRTPKTPGEKTCKAINKLARASFKATLFCAIPLFLATIIGGLVVDIPTTTVAIWIYGVLFGIFGFFLALSFILFLVWYLPRPVAALLIAGILVTIGMLIFVYPDGMFNLNLDKSLNGLFGDVKELLKPLLDVIDSIF